MGMSKRFLSILLMATFLGVFIMALPISPVRATTCDVIFMAWDYSGDSLPDYGCEWHIIFPNSTYRTFSGNMMTLESLPSGDYDVSLKWLDSWVVHNYSWTTDCLHTPDYLEVSTKVTEVTISANDHAANPLYDDPCYLYIEYPNGTTKEYPGRSITVMLGNDTYKLGVKWQGTYVVSNETWAKDVETSYQINCTQLVDRTFTAEDSSENQLWSGATKIWVRLPNGTLYTSPTNSSSFTLMKVVNGTYKMRVMFEGSKVFGEKSYPLIHISDHVDFRIPCSVYGFTPVLQDQNGVGYSGANISLLCQNGTTRHLITDSNGRVTIPQIQNGSYSIPNVVYNGHRVNQTGSFLIGGDLTDWHIQFHGLSINRTEFPTFMHLNSSFTIRAQLVYSYSGEPISGGVVGLIGASEMNATTDASGWATFEDLSEWQPTEPFTLFGMNDSDYGFTYPMQNKSIPITWTGDFNVRALDAESVSLNNANLLIYNGTDVYWKTVNSDSMGFIHVRDAVCQDYVVNVVWKGVDVGSGSFDLNRAVIDETISCTVYSGYVRVNNLTDLPIEGASVDVLWSSEDLYEAHETNGTGFTPLIFQIPQGTYILKIGYSDGAYKDTVNVYPGFEFQYIIAAVSVPDVPGVEAFLCSTESTVNAIRYVQTFSEVNVEVTGPSGSEGYLEIFVPKAFLSHFGLTIDDVHVFFDDTPLEYSYVEYADGYLLTVSYQHSSHTLEVIFSDITLSADVKDGNSVGLVNAYIKLDREGYQLRSGDTDENGQLSFTELPTGNYMIYTYQKGVLVKTDELTITGDASYSAVCPVYDLTIQVFDMIPSSLPGASVTASLHNGTVLFSGTTDGAGNVTFRQVPAEDYKIEATYFGISSSTDIIFNQNLVIQVVVSTLNMMTIVFLLVVVGVVAVSIGIYYSRRREEKPKRRRGRPRKVKPPI